MTAVKFDRVIISWMLWTVSGRYHVPADFGLQCILNVGWFIDMQLFKIILYLCGIYCIVKMRNGRLFMSGDSFLKLYSVGSFHAIWNLGKLQCGKNDVSVAKDSLNSAEQLKGQNNQFINFKTKIHFSNVRPNVC